MQVRLLDYHLAMQVKYCKTAPSNQTLADIFEGRWFTGFPEEYGVRAGGLNVFDQNVETRLNWGTRALSKSIRGSTILELGPFEGYNTWAFERLGARSVTAIEASNINFLKCLIVKEMTGMKARLLHGDFVPFMEQTADRFDIVWASGVLYHQAEPLRLIASLARVTDRIFVHTHYYDEAAIAQLPEVAASFSPAEHTEQEYGGFRARLYRRRYGSEMDVCTFAGGGEAFSYWMSRDDILDGVRHAGFTRIHLGVDHVENPSGPAMYFVAEKLDSRATDLGLRDV